MAGKRRNNTVHQTPPPSRETRGGGASEHAQFQWLIESQSNVNHSLGRFDADLENIQNSIQELKVMSQENSASLIKLNYKLIWATGFLTGAVIVSSFLITNFIDGKFNTLIQKIETSNIKSGETKKG